MLKKLFKLRAKTYSYFKDNDEYKKAKGTKKCVTKKILSSEIIKNV